MRDSPYLFYYISSVWKLKFNNIYFIYAGRQIGLPPRKTIISGCHWSFRVCPDKIHTIIINLILFSIFTGVIYYAPTKEPVNIQYNKTKTVAVCWCYHQRTISNNNCRGMIRHAHNIISKYGIIIPIQRL